MKNTNAAKKGKSITCRKHDKTWAKSLTALDHTSCSISKYKERN
jgi:hypothetical protein